MHTGHSYRHRGLFFLSLLCFFGCSLSHFPTSSASFASSAFSLPHVHLSPQSLKNISFSSFSSFFLCFCPHLLSTLARLLPRSAQKNVPSFSLPSIATLTIDINDPTQEKEFVCLFFPTSTQHARLAVIVIASTAGWLAWLVGRLMFEGLVVDSPEGLFFLSLLKRERG